MEKTFTYNELDDTYSAVIFSSDNVSKLVMLPAAYNWLKKKAYTDEIIVYFDPIPIANPKDSRLRYGVASGRFRSNSENDIGMKLINVEMEEVNGVILKVIGKFRLHGPKQEIVKSLIDSELINLQIKPRCIVGQGGDDMRRVYIHFLTGLYLVQVKVKIKAKGFSCGG